MARTLASSYLNLIEGAPHSACGGWGGGVKGGGARVEGGGVVHEKGVNGVSVGVCVAERGDRRGGREAEGWQPWVLTEVGAELMALYS